MFDFFKRPQLGRRLFGKPEWDRKATKFIRAPKLGEKIIGGSIGKKIDKVATENRDKIIKEVIEKVFSPKPQQ